MIDDFAWQLNLYNERQGLSSICQEDSKRHESAVTPDTTERSVTPQSALANDIQVLTNTYGVLYPAKEITIDLGTACKLLGRHRKRVDAFSRLQKYLSKEYQVTLKITSRKNR